MTNDIVATKEIETKACRCMGFGHCAPAPNRCRKPFKEYGMGFGSCSPSQWDEATRQANAAIGQDGFELHWCLSSEPVLMRI